MKIVAWAQHCLNRFSRQALVGGIVFVMIFGLYGLTAARTMTGFGDSDELIVAGYTASLAHPPGYPLLTGFLFLASHLPGLNPAVGAHLLAALIMATTMWLLYSIAATILLSQPKQANWGNLSRIGLLIFLVASSGLLWEHGTHIEVFGLNALLSVLFLKLTMKKPSILWALVGGIGLSHHQTLVLIWLPLVIWSVVSNRKSFLRWMPLIGALFVGFGLGYGWIWVFGNHVTPFSWKFTPTIEGIWKFYSRSDYSGYSPELGMLSAWWSGFSVHGTIESWKFYVGEMWNHWNIIILLGVGALFGRKQMGRWFWPLLLGFVFAGPLLAGYISVPVGIPGTVEYETGLAITERMYVLADAWFGIWVVLGGYWLTERLTSYIVSRVSWLPRNIGIFLLSVMVLGWVGSRFQGHNLSAYQAADVYAREVMEFLPMNTRLLCLSDVSCFGTAYIQAVLGGRTDILVISSAAQYRGNYTSQHSNLARFTYPDNPYRLGEIVGWSTLHGYPVAVAQLNAYWANELGLNGEAFRLTPLPYSLAIIRDAVGVVPAYRPVYAATQLLIESPLSYRYVQVLRAVITEHHALASHLFLQMDNRDFAKEELTAGLLLDPDNQILLSVQQTIETALPDPNYRLKLTDSGYEVRIRDCEQRGDAECALWQSRWFTWRNPELVQARLSFARNLEAKKMLPFAKREFKHVLELDSDNTEAHSALNRLSPVIDLGDTLF